MITALTLSAPAMAAAKGGHLDCLKYAHENGCPWDASTCSSAASGIPEPVLHVFERFVRRGTRLRGTRLRDRLRVASCHGGKVGAGRI